MTLTFAASKLPIRIHLYQPLSDEELARFSSENEPLLIERDAEGQLIVTPPNGSKDALFHTQIASEVSLWARANAQGKCFSANGGFHLPDTSVRAADLSWVSNAPWNALTSKQQKGFAPLCPECVIEVRALTDRLPPLREKMHMWLTNGAQLAWLIDPELKTVEIYRPNQAPELYHNPTSVQGTGPVQGFELVLTPIWS